MSVNLSWLWSVWSSLWSCVRFCLRKKIGPEKLLIPALVLSLVSKCLFCEPILKEFWFSDHETSPPTPAHAYIWPLSKDSTHKYGGESPITNRVNHNLLIGVNLADWKKSLQASKLHYFEVKCTLTATSVAEKLNILPLQTCFKLQKYVASVSRTNRHSSKFSSRLRQNIKHSYFRYLTSKCI